MKRNLIQGGCRAMIYIYNWLNARSVTKSHKSLAGFCHLQSNRHSNINEAFKSFKIIARNFKVLFMWLTLNRNEIFYAASLSIKYQENDKPRYLQGIMLKRERSLV